MLVDNTQSIFNLQMDQIVLRSSLEHLPEDVFPEILNQLSFKDRLNLRNTSPILRFSQVRYFQNITSVEFLIRQQGDVLKVDASLETDPQYFVAFDDEIVLSWDKLKLFIQFLTNHIRLTTLRLFVGTNVSISPFHVRRTLRLIVVKIGQHDGQRIKTLQIQGFGNLSLTNYERYTVHRIFTQIMNHRFPFPNLETFVCDSPFIVPAFSLFVKSAFCSLKNLNIQSETFQCLPCLPHRLTTLSIARVKLARNQLTALSRHAHLTKLVLSHRVTLEEMTIRHPFVFPNLLDLSCPAVLVVTNEEASEDEEIDTHRAFLPFHRVLATPELQELTIFSSDGAFLNLGLHLLPRAMPKLKKFELTDMQWNHWSSRKVELINNKLYKLFETINDFPHLKTVSISLGIFSGYRIDLNWPEVVLWLSTLPSLRFLTLDGLFYPGTSYDWIASLVLYAHQLQFLSIDSFDAFWTNLDLDNPDDRARIIPDKVVLGIADAFRRRSPAAPNFKLEAGHLRDTSMVSSLRNLDVVSPLGNSSSVRMMKLNLCTILLYKSA